MSVYRSFFFASKKVQGCSSNRKILIIALSSTRQSPFFEILILSRDFWGNVYHVHEINLISSWNLIKAFWQIKRNWRHGFADERQLKTIVKINVFTNILWTFLLFKARHFFQFSFREKRVLSFPLLDKWNVHNSIEMVKVYFSIVFYDGE